MSGPFYREDLLPLPLVQDEQVVSYYILTTWTLILINCLKEACQEQFTKLDMASLLSGSVKLNKQT